VDVRQQDATTRQARTTAAAAADVVAAGAQHNVVNIHTSSFSALNLLIHCM